MTQQTLEKISKHDSVDRLRYIMQIKIQALIKNESYDFVFAVLTTTKTS